jgi:hypothetical protein
MLQLVNATPFEATVVPLVDRDGVDVVFTVVKGTFTIGERVALADEQVPIAFSDAHHGDPKATSVRIPSDVSLHKPGTDVVLLGSAVAPNEKEAWQSTVSVSVGPVVASADIFADRRWNVGANGATMEWVAPFVRMPLVWERAYGGTEETAAGPRFEPRNPVGVGFRAARGGLPRHGDAVPNIERSDRRITSSSDAPPPAGFAPLGGHWQPRASYAGTYDDAWQQTRAPFLPADLDPRFFQIAPPELVTNGYLAGGEGVDLRGVTPQGALRFTLPIARPSATYKLEGRPIECAAILDTVILQPDEGRMSIVWRASFRADKKTLKIREVRVTVAEASVR